MMNFAKGISVAVIGAGPAGLAAACALRHRGIDVIVYESGKTLSKRQHDTAADIAVGVGGAGLFSDGKFSYYPSGTHVYRLAHRERLRKAYRWLSLQLQSFEIGVEPFPSDVSQIGMIAGSIREKKYPSHYASLEQRKELVTQLSQAVEGPIITNAKVHHIKKIPDGYLLGVTENNIGSVSTDPVSAIVLATGRFGGLALSEGRICGTIPLKELRYEFGIRIECHHSVGFLNRSTLPDVKCLWELGTAQIRTFCTCRRGEVWNISYDTLSAISGRADGPPTEFSNFGVLARFEGKKLNAGSQLWNHLRTHSLQTSLAIWEPIGSFLQDLPLGMNENVNVSSRPWLPRDTFQRGEIRRWLGEQLSTIVEAAVRELLAWSPDLADRRTVCLFPAIEGTGFYPDTDENLRVRGHSIWCAGDVVGRFRGLVPALLSGYYAGLSVKENYLR